MADSVDVFLRLIGARRFQADARTSAAALGTIDKSADRAGRSHSRFGAAAAGALGMAGRAALATGAAAGIAGGAAAVMGLKFNAAMEQSTVAFTQLLGSEKEAKAMLDTLATTAEKTPFSFQGLTKSAQQLLGVGFAAKDVIPTMTAVADAVAGTGGGTEEVEGVTRALTQIQTQGRLSTEELNQMSERGVPALKILSQELGVSGGQLRKQIESGAISSDKAISALTEGMRKRYGGMSAAQSKTFSGMISNAKDSAQRIMGALTLPLFNFLRDKVFPQVLKVGDGFRTWAEGGGVQRSFDQIKQGFSGGVTAGGGISKVFQTIGSVIRPVVDYVKELFAAFKPMAPFLSNVLWPILKGLAMGFGGALLMGLKGLIPVIKIVATALGWFGTIMAPFKGVLQTVAMAIGFLFSPFSKLGIVVKGMGIGIRVLVAVLRFLFSPMLKVLGILRSLLPAFGKIVSFIVGKYIGAWRMIISGAGKVIGVLGRVVSFIVGKYIGAWRRVISAVSAVVRFTITAGPKVFGAVKNLVSGAVRALGGLVSGFARIGRRAVEGLVDAIRSGVSAGAGFVAGVGKGIANFIIGALNDALPDKINMPSPIPDVSLPSIPTLARGGVTPGGPVLVGERGPELLTPPRGSLVTPLTTGPRGANTALSLPGAGGRSGTINIPVYLDRRQIATAMGEYTADRQAMR